MEKKFNLCDVGTMCVAKKKESIKVDERRRMMKKKILYEEFMDKGLVDMNFKEANENKVKMDKPQQQIQNEQIFLKHKKSNDERKKEVEEFGKMLQSGIKEYIESDRYKELLDNMANFHDYSVNNSIGIMIQKPDATLVAPYTK